MLNQAGALRGPKKSSWKSVSFVNKISTTQASIMIRPSPLDALSTFWNIFPLMPNFFSFSSFIWTNILPKKNMPKTSS